MENKTVIMKILNLHEHDVVECSRKGFSSMSCYEIAAARILEKIGLLTELQHKNIIKVRYLCWSLC